MKKLFAFMLAAVLCCSMLINPADAVSLDETTQAAAVLNMMGAIQGDGSGDLGLSATLTRAQFCKIAVVVMGLSSKVSQYSGYTIFPDVPSTSWAAGYINLAVRSAGIMTGYTNGKFGPDDIITYGQAVTVLMKMLGYTTIDVGAKWPDGFVNKAQEIGLTDGVSLGASASLTKGDMAVLFLNLLNTEINNSVKTYMETISVTVVSNVFLVSTNAVTDSGKTDAIQVAGAKNASYLPVNAVPESLIGVYGSLVLNASGKAVAFVPTNNGTTVISTVVSATASYIKCANGTKISMTASPAFYLDGKSSAYADSWISVGGGMLVSAYYTDGGTVENVLVTAVSSGGGTVTVVTSDTYALPSTADVYINGAGATASDILKYDVVSYDDDYGVCSVSRRAVTGRYDSAYPNGENAETITVMGTEFTVLDSAVDALADFAVGSTVTLLLTADKTVAGVISQAFYNCPNYGVVRSLISSNATVDLACGVTVSGKVSNVSSDIAAGSLVTVGAYEKGTLSLSPVYDTTNAPYLNLTAGTLGSASLSKALKVYECVGKSGVTEISLSDIPSTTVDAAKIKFIAYDTSGKVGLLLLNDVTGDRYTYGVIKNGIKTETVSVFTVTNATTTVTNADGSVSVIGNTSLGDGTYAGVAPSVSGSLAGYATLTSVTGVSRSSFTEGTDGTQYVTTTVGLVPVSDTVQAYITATETWTTLAKARSYTDNLTVYYDRTPSTGGEVRVIIAH